LSEACGSSPSLEGEAGARSAVGEVLVLLSEREVEKALVERFYEVFFAANPEVVPLFGVHALAEREEMMRETLKSLLACCEAEPWLEGNLRALGASHAEYGVTSEMYPGFVEAFVEVVRELLGAALSAEAESSLRSMTGWICGVMAAAGEGHAH
jgi:hemoglobin-like flavoprotein